MKQVQIKEEKIILCDRTPLAVCLEIAAHLRQVESVNVTIIPQGVGEDLPGGFNYAQSQVKGLLIEFPADLEAKSKQQVEEILNYYGLENKSKVIGVSH